MAIELKSRKLQSVSDYSFFVTIPKIWVRSVSMLKGDLIKMSINNGGKLILEANKHETQKTSA